MAENTQLDELVAETYKRSLLAAVLPYILLGIALAGLFIWRVAVTDPDWDATPDAAERAS